MIAALRTVSERLDGAELAWMLTGSIAVNFFTVPRSTQDIDLLVALTPEKTQELLAAFATDFYIDADEVTKETKRGGMFNLIFLPTFTRIDFIVLNENAYETEKFRRRKRVLFEGIPVWMITAEDLILSKIQWIQQVFSEKQAQDIRALLQTPDLDLSYLQSWKTQLNLNSYGLL